MTTDTTPLAPTDAELEAFAIDEQLLLFCDMDEFTQIARAVLDKWGQPAHSGEPVEPDFYTACALYEGGGEGGWIALPGYSNETEHGVKHLVLEAARKEDWKGTATGRLMALGWEIRPVYLAPLPVAREPLPSVEIMRIVMGVEQQHNFLRGTTNWAAAVGRAIEAAHGITKRGQHG